MARVLLGMSGGIDSTVAAILLQKQGHQVLGLTLRLWSETDDVHSLVESHYISEARETAENIGLKHVVADVRKMFYDKVIQYFKTEYLAGRTPNPCAKCNVVLKWDVLNHYAQAYNCDFIATGHYVQKEKVGERFYIKKGIDPDKEQSFFLWGLGQDILQKAIFPLGTFTKSEVRALAQQNGFIELSKKKESTGICFLKGAYQDFLRKIIDREGINITSGNFIDENGAVVGKHRGYPFYTVGQRRGLGLVPREPYYVKEICPHKNQIILGNRKSLVCKGMWVSQYHIIHPEDFKNGVITRIRYRKQAAPSRIEFVNNKRLKVEFVHSEWSIAPGQTAVFYDDNRLLGGGYIEKPIF